MFIRNSLIVCAKIIHNTYVTFLYLCIYTLEDDCSLFYCLTLIISSANNKY